VEARRDTATKLKQSGIPATKLAPVAPGAVGAHTSVAATMWRPAIATIRVLLRESAVPFLQSRNSTAAGTRGINASQSGAADVRRLTPV
jgi:hypothetical protein